MWRAGLVLTVVLTLLAGASAPVAADPASPWSPGPNATGADTYSGFIDSPKSGTTLAPNGTVNLQGWVVDQTAIGWTGIDDVQVYLGTQDQGTLMSHAAIGVRRDDVAAALGNAYWDTAGFSTSFSTASLAVGPNTLTIYAHSPSKGYWFKQVQVIVPAAPARAYADDPLLIVTSASPSLDVPQTINTLVLTGYAIDRNMPENVQLGAGGSGVSSVQAYLDGPKTSGNGQGALLATAILGQKDRDATGFGERFLMSGWQLIVHPTDLTVDQHELYIYADSAYWPSETLVVVPFTIH